MKTVALLLALSIAACSYPRRYSARLFTDEGPSAASQCLETCRGRTGDDHYACVAACPGVRTRDNASCGSQETGPGKFCEVERKTDGASITAGVLIAGIVLTAVIVAVATTPFCLPGPGEGEGSGDC